MAGRDGRVAALVDVEQGVEVRVVDQRGVDEHRRRDVAGREPLRDLAGRPRRARQQAQQRRQADLLRRHRVEARVGELLHRVLAALDELDEQVDREVGRVRVGVVERVRARLLRRRAQKADHGVVQAERAQLALVEIRALLEQRDDERVDRR